MKRFFARSFVFSGLARNHTRLAYSLALRQRYLHSSARVLSIPYQSGAAQAGPLDSQKPTNAKSNAKPDGREARNETAAQTMEAKIQREQQQAKQGSGTENLTYEEIAKSPFSGSIQSNTRLTNAVKQMAPNVMSKREYATVADKAKEVKDAVVDKAKDVKDAAMKKGKDVKDAVVDKAKDVKDAVASNPNVKDAVKSGKEAKDATKRAGQDAVDATKQKRSYATIADTAEKVANKVVQKGEEIKNAIEKNPTVKKVERKAAEYVKDAKDKTQEVKESSEKTMKAAAQQLNETGKQMDQRAETARNAYQAQPAAEDQGVIGRVVEKAKNMFK